MTHETAYTQYWRRAIGCVPSLVITRAELRRFSVETEDELLEVFCATEDMIERVAAFAAAEDDRDLVLDFEAETVELVPKRS